MLPVFDRGCGLWTTDHSPMTTLPLSNSPTSLRTMRAVRSGVGCSGRRRQLPSRTGRGVWPARSQPRRQDHARQAAVVPVPADRRSWWLRFGRPGADRAGPCASAMCMRTRHSRAILTASGLLALLRGYEPGAGCRAQTRPAAAQRVGLADRAHEPIAQFSKGMVQRLGIAQAFSAIRSCSCLTSRARDSTLPAGS